MLHRMAYARSLRLVAPIQRRLYTLKPGGEAAEFTAKKPTSNTTKFPRQATEMATASDPKGVANMNPPHAGHEGGAKKNKSLER
ncbi:hypothetical protein E4U41_003632 [Claviceps citrina]|nr:hypothetical protein E4U41_003632 [Claviceps citrina]